MSEKLKNLKDYALFFLLLALAAAFSFNPAFSSSFAEGLKLWAAVVLPALFPYAFITAIMSSLSATGKLAYKLSPLSKKVFNVGGATLFAFFTGLISGYPVGAKTVADLYKRGLLGEAESVRAAALCSTASPVFLIVSVGGTAFGDTLFGAALFLTHLLSAVIVGVIFSFYKRKEKPLNERVSFFTEFDNLLYDCAYNSAVSVLVVGGLIAVFYLLSDMLCAYRILDPFINFFALITGDFAVGKGISLGIIECTKGIKVLSSSGISFLSLPVCAALCGFGGLSVIAQSLAFLKKAKIKTAAFILIKLLSAAVNFAIGLIFSLIFFG